MKQIKFSAVYFILWITIKTIKETATDPECRSTTHRQDVMRESISHNNTYRSSLASCHKAMPIQVKRANL